MEHFILELEFNIYCADAPIVQRLFRLCVKVEIEIAFLLGNASNFNIILKGALESLLEANVTCKKAGACFCGARDLCSVRSSRAKKDLTIKRK
jgi:hypothetical protein